MANFHQLSFADSDIDLDDVCFVGAIKFNSYSEAYFDIVMRTSGKAITVSFTGQMPSITSQAKKCRENLISCLYNL